MISATDPDTPVTSLRLVLELDHAVVESTSNTSSHGLRYTRTTSTIDGILNADGTGYLSPNLDPWTAGGTYTITRATLSDPEGNSTSYDTAQLAAAGFDTSFKVIADTTPPVLNALSFSPRVTLLGGPMSESFGVMISDPGGLGFVRTVLHLDPAFGTYADLSVKSVSGYTDPYGYYSGNGTTQAFLVNSYPGVHSITGVTITDYAGNVADYSSVQLRAMGIATSFYVGPPARADFDGEGHSDILWRNADGSVSTWSTSGTGASDGVRQDTFDGRADVAWRIVDTFDWNGDGRADILWRNQNGNVSLWTGQASGFQQNAFNITSVGNAWSIAGAGDLDGDGKGDLLWRNQDGSLSSWLSTGTSFQQNAYFHGAVSTSWKIEGLGDFNGDGKADILWRNDNGALSVWNSTGTSFQESSVYHDAVDRSWHIVGIGDFNGDGRDDILWRNDNGAVSIWQGSATGFAESRMNDAASTSWSVAEVGDFNADGLADILWRNTSGAISIWHSTGSAWQQNTYSGSASTDWSIAGHAFPL